MYHKFGFLITCEPGDEFYWTNLDSGKAQTFLYGTMQRLQV